MDGEKEKPRKLNLEIPDIFRNISGFAMGFIAVESKHRKEKKLPFPSNKKSDKIILPNKTKLSYKK